MHQLCSARFPLFPSTDHLHLKSLWQPLLLQTFPCVSYVSSFHLVLKSQPTKTRFCKMFLFSIFLCVNFPKRPFKKENYKVRYIKGCQIQHVYCNKAIKQTLQCIVFPFVVSRSIVVSRSYTHKKIQLQVKSQTKKIFQIYKGRYFWMIS